MNITAKELFEFIDDRLKACKVMKPEYRANAMYQAFGAMMFFCRVQGYTTDEISTYWAKAREEFGTLLGEE